MHSGKNTLKMNGEIKKRVGFQAYMFSFLSKWAWKGVKISFTTSLMSPAGVSKKAPPVLWMTQRLQAISIWWPHVCAAVFTFHSTWGLRAANSPHQLLDQSPLSLTAGPWILTTPRQMSGNGRPAPWQPSAGDCRYGLDFTSDHLDTASSAGPSPPLGVSQQSISEAVALCRTRQSVMRATDV